MKERFKKFSENKNFLNEHLEVKNVHSNNQEITF